jgi:F-type H+-transporting ATPase subunit gamma
LVSLRLLRRRVRSVKSTQQITRAMKMVAAAKLRRAQDDILAARPYAEGMEAVLRSLALRVDPDSHPLLAEREGGPGLLVVITADKGLCGAFNANILKASERFFKERADEEIAVEAVGRLARDYFKHRGRPMRAERVGLFRKLEYDAAHEISRNLQDAFVGGEIGSVHLLYNEFKSVLQQKVVVRQLLPIERERKPQLAVDYIYEPGPNELLETLLPRHVDVQIWRALLESQAAEHAARMTAMEAATTNAQEMIERLTLQLNKARQASITKEILEVVGGAEALKA